MNAQAPAGWYPDGQGNERYWNGSTWMDHVRPLAVAAPPAPDVSAADPAPALVEPAPAKKDGTFGKLGAAVKKVSADKRAVKEEILRKQAEDAAAAGPLVTSGVFGTSTIELYEHGYVRVAEGRSDMESPVLTTADTPYEKLRSIKVTAPQNDKGNSSCSDTMALVKNAKDLMKGGAGLMKSTVPGMVVAGLTQMASNEAGKAYLTIATDRAIHTLSNQSSNGFTSKNNRGHLEIALALEVAANAVLGGATTVSVEASAAPQQLEASQPPTAAQASATPGLSERLRELAALHADGILSDEEFASAKARLLSAL